MNLEIVNCPCCNSNDYSYWAEELNFTVTRCSKCKLLYVNPRPALQAIDSAVRKGEHALSASNLNVRSRRISKKIRLYKLIIKNMFSDVWHDNKNIIWVDVGSGYGETLEAVRSLASIGSTIIGVEPMQHKADIAKKAGLNIINSYLQSNKFKANFISAVDIFSHIPDFHSFLKIAATNLAPGGELFIESGNLADLDSRNEFPGELGLPDHLVFAGELQLKKYLNDAGFDVVDIRRERVDGIINLTKNIVKKII